MMHTFGIVGFGTIGKLYADVLQRSPSCRVAAIADPDASAAMTDEVENIIIATPPSTHAAITSEALRRGKNVLLEKPPARSVREAESLIAMSREAGRTLFFGFHARYNVAVQRAAIELSSRTVQSFHAVYRENVRKYHTNEWVFREGVLRDSGINVLSILTAVLPGADRMHVTGSGLQHSRELDSDVAAKVTFEEPDGVLEMDWLTPGTESRHVDIQTSVGNFRIDIITDTLFLDGQRIVTDERTESLDREYTRMVADFIEHIEDGTSCTSTNELRLLEQIYSC
jgi:D-galactose 1-dehydrogenase